VKKVIILLFLAAFVAFLGYRVRMSLLEKEAQRNVKPPVIIRMVDVASPVMREVNDVVQTWGNVESSAKVIVYSNLPGKVLQLYVREDALVTKGDTLAQIDRNLQPMDYSETYVVAPASGVVTKRLLDDGAIITPATPLYIIEDLSELIVSAPVEQSDIGKIRVGTPTAIYCDAFPEDVFSARVARIAATSDPATHATRVESRMPGGKIKPGMFVRLEYLIGKRNVLFAPSLVIDEVNGKKTAALLKNGVVRIVPIETGRRDGDQIEILTGLSLDDVVISSGRMELAEGDSVVVKSRITQ